MAKTVGCHNPGTVSRFLQTSSMNRVSAFTVLSAIAETFVPASPGPVFGMGPQRSDQAQPLECDNKVEVTVSIQNDTTLKAAQHMEIRQKPSPRCVSYVKELIKTPRPKNTGKAFSFIKIKIDFIFDPLNCPPNSHDFK